MIVGAGMAAAFQVGKAPPVLPLLRQELSLSLFMSGWVISAFYVVGFTIAPIAGGLADRLGIRRMIFAGLACQALASLCGAMAQGPHLLLFTRVFEGLGYIIVVVSCPGLIMKYTRLQDRRMAFGVWGCCMPTGGAVMMLAAPWLVELAGWRGLWATNSVLLTGYIFLLAAVTRDFRGDGGSGRFSLPGLLQDIRLVIKSGGPVLFAFCFGTYALQFIAVIGFLPTMLIEGEGLSRTVAASLSALVLFMNVPGNLLGGRLLQRGTPRYRILAVAGAVMGLCSLGIFSPFLSLPVRYVLCLLFSGVGGMLPATALEGAAATAPSPELGATSQGVLMQGVQLGLLIGPPTVAAVVSHFGSWSYAPWVLAPAAGMVVGLALFLRGWEARRAAAA